MGLNCRYLFGKKKKNTEEIIIDTNYYFFVIGYHCCFYFSNPFFVATPLFYLPETYNTKKFFVQNKRLRYEPKSLTINPLGWLQAPAQWSKMLFCKRFRIIIRKPKK